MEQSMKQDEKPLTAFGVDLAVRMVELFTFIAALVLVFQSSIFGFFYSFGIFGQIGHLLVILLLIMGVLTSLRRLNEVFLYRRAAKVSGTYWRGQPRCPFLVVKSNFSCAITPDEPFPLEEIGKCHVMTRWKLCWEREKLPVMKDALETEMPNPGLYARLSWQWGMMGSEFDTCPYLLDALKIMRQELVKITEGESYQEDEKSVILLEKRWKNALSVGLWSAERCKCTEKDFVEEIISIAESFSTLDDKIHQRLLLYFNQGGKKASSYLLEHVRENLTSLNPDILFNHLQYLGYAQNEDAVPLLRELVLTHESNDIKVQAAYMLVEMKRKSAIKALITILEDTGDEMIISIVRDALKSVKYDGLHHLIDLLEDDSLIQESYDLLLVILEKYIPDVEYKEHARWLLKKKEGLKMLQEEIQILEEHGFPEMVVGPLKEMYNRAAFRT